MKKEEFRELYKTKLPRLKGILKDLDAKLAMYISRYHEAKYLDPGKPIFRIRLRESRVKEPDSLYDKIQSRSDLSFDIAFDPGIVHDLLGTRIVCPNLRDVYEIARAIKRGDWEDIYYLEPGSGQKKWIVDGHPDSKYRGWHLDIKWTPAGSQKYAYAELQIRTLLQDAWATFLHDDIYKREARNTIIPTSVYTHLGHFSDLLYVLDNMAEGLRDSIENSELAGNSHVRLFDALMKSMYALLDFQQNMPKIPVYKSIVRKDEYLINGIDGIYRYEFEGEAMDPSLFIFPIAGDSGTANYDSLRIKRIKKNGEVIEIERSVIEKSISNIGSHVICYTDKSRKRKHHHYLIECNWRNVFEIPLEYVWCPWEDLYRTIDAINYELLIKFKKPPRKRPALYRLIPTHSLGDVLKEYDEDTRESEVSCEILSEGENQFEYKFVPAEGKRNYICLFKP